MKLMVEYNYNCMNMNARMIWRIVHRLSAVDSGDISPNPTVKCVTTVKYNVLSNELKRLLSFSVPYNNAT